RTVSLTRSHRIILVTRKPPRTTLFPYTALFRSRGLDLSNVVLADAAGQVVGDEDIGFERVTVPPELQYDADTLLNMVEDCLNGVDRESTRLNSSHVKISYAVFCLKKKIAILYHK